jgi:hypothetical protein
MQNLINSVIDSNSDENAVIILLRAVTSNQSAEEVLEILDIATEEEVSKFWEQLRNFLTKVVKEELLSDHASENSSSIKAAATLVLSCCEKNAPNSSFAYDTLLVLSQLLSSSTIGGLSAATKRAVSKACEHWWVNEGQGSGNFVAVVLPYLLSIAVQPDALDVDIKRVYAMRNAFFLLEFENSSFIPTRELILRSFISPLFLKVFEGQKFLAFIMTINDGNYIMYHI